MTDPTGDRPSHGAALKRSVVALVATPLVLALAWVLLNVALRGPAPAPRWTEADLPPLPPESDNGWVGLAMRGERVGDTKMSGELTAVLDAAPPQMLPLAKKASPELDGLLATPAAIRGLAMWSSAMKLPRFVDACPLTVDTPCSVLVVLKAHQLALLAALHRGASGAWDAAIGGVARAVVADMDAATSSRTLISARVTATDLRQSLAALDALLAGHEASGAPTLGADTRAMLGRVRAGLGELDGQNLGLRRTVIAEYVFTRRALEGAAAAPSTPLEHVGFALFYDPRATFTETARRAEALLATVERGAPTPSFPRLLNERGWWLLDPVGKVALDGIGAAWPSALERAATDRTRTLGMVSSVRARANALLDKTPSPPEP